LGTFRRVSRASAPLQLYGRISRYRSVDSCSLPGQSGNRCQRRRTHGRSGNVVMGFSSRLQINPVSFWVGRDIRHGRFASNCLFAFPKAQSVNDRKHDNCDDRPKYDFHCTLHHQGANGRFPVITAPNRSHRTKTGKRTTLLAASGSSGFSDLGPLVDHVNLRAQFS
jgi:hypothetical protein